MQVSSNGDLLQSYNIPVTGIYRMKTMCLYSDRILIEISYTMVKNNIVLRDLIRLYLMNVSFHSSNISIPMQWPYKQAYISRSISFGQYWAFMSMLKCHVVVSIDMLVLILYTILAIKHGHGRYELKRGKDEYIYLDRGIYSIGNIDEHNGTRISTAIDICTFIPLCSNHMARSGDELIKYLHILDSTYCADEIETVIDTLLSTDMDFASNIRVWKWSTRIPTRHKILESMILHLKAIQIVQSMVDTYPPVCCKAPIYPIRSLFMVDITFIISV